MCLAYDSASKGIVAKVNPASGSEYSINIRDEANFMGRIDTNNNFVLGRRTFAGSNGTYICNYANTPGNERILMEWADNNTRSFVQSIDDFANAVPSLSTNNTMSMGYDATNRRLVARVVPSAGPPSAFTVNVPSVEQIPIRKDADDNVIVGTRSSTVTGKNGTYLCNNAATASGEMVLMQWDAGKRSAVQAVDDFTNAVPTLSASNTMSMGYDATNKRLVARVVPNAGSASAFTVHVPSVEHVPVRKDASNNVIVGSRTAALTGANGTYLCNSAVSASGEIVLMQWGTGKRSAVQAVDDFGTTVPTLSESNTMSIGYDATNQRIVATVFPSVGNVFTVNMSSTDRMPVRTDANENVIVGKRSTAVSGSNGMYICNNAATANAEAILVQWPAGKRSGVYAINTTATAPTLSQNETMCFAYNSAESALVVNIQTSSGSQFTLNLKDTPSPYRSIVQINTATATLSATDHPNRFVVYNPSGSTPTTTQTITICNGLQPGVEIEIFNRTEYPVLIDPSPPSGSLLVGYIASVNQLKKISSKGAAIIKVFTNTNGTSSNGTPIGPEYMLIGALTA